MRRIANQLIKRSKEHLLAGGKLWDQDKLALVANLEAADRLHAAFVEQCGALLAGRGAAAEATASQAFAKFGLFSRRCRKLVEMFSTVAEFSQLAAHTHIEGMDAVMARFSQLLDDIKRRPYDLLDFAKNQFDRDLLEFSVNINDLEVALQGVINASFERSPSTEQSLLLLRQFELLLRRESFRSDLDAKYVAAFLSFSADLEAVQKLYEKHKGAPPVARNSPPVAGNIMWARHLLRRIEGPMKCFAQRRELMAAKDSKKAIKLYNKLAQALLEYEALWHQAWLRSVENAKAQLSATLLGQHPQTGGWQQGWCRCAANALNVPLVGCCGGGHPGEPANLGAGCWPACHSPCLCLVCMLSGPLSPTAGHYYVNFDKQILQLMRETKHMRRLGLAVPDAAHMVVLQEEKFKHYYSQLSHALRELDRVLAGIKPALRVLLSAHMEDLNAKIQPGLLVLTWSSMNIDGYLHRFHQVGAQGAGCQQGCSLDAATWVRAGGWGRYLCRELGGGSGQQA